MTTTTKPPPPSAALSLSALVPPPVRSQLRWRVPLDARLAGSRCLIVSVGSGVPLRWLQLTGEESGLIRMRLWEVRQDSRTLAEATVESDRVASTLQGWATLYLTGEPTDAVGGLREVGVKG